MIETRDITPEFHTEVTLVNPEADFANFDVVAAAEAATVEGVAAQEMVSGAEQLLHETAAEQTPVAEAEANSVEFNMDMVRLFMFLKNEEARNVVAAAIAIDAVGQQHGVEELTFRNAAARRYAADRETERLIKAREDNDKEED